MFGLPSIHAALPQPTVQIMTMLLTITDLSGGSAQKKVNLTEGGRGEGGGGSPEAS